MEDIIPNHLVSVPDPNAAIVRRVMPIPVEVIVRGFNHRCYIHRVMVSLLIGRARNFMVYKFPEGLRKNQQLPEPIITPTPRAVQPDTMND